MDTITRQRRSENMRRIRSIGMKPELTVRRIVHKLGYRYRLHDTTLPGRPDLVFPSRRKIIFVNGCFWHQHRAARCTIRRMPKSNVDYWQNKLRSNEQRDTKNQLELKRLGWKVLVVWECKLRKTDRLREQLNHFLQGNSRLHRGTCVARNMKQPSRFAS